MNTEHSDTRKDKQEVSGGDNSGDKTQLLRVEAYIEGKGESEPKMVEKHLEELKKEDVCVCRKVLWRRDI